MSRPNAADLGSGGGIDVLLSAKRVGPTGKVYGLDMTNEMLALARENQRKAGATNVEFGITSLGTLRYLLSQGAPSIEPLGLSED